MTLTSQDAFAWSKQDSAVGFSYGNGATYPKSFEATSTKGTQYEIVSSTLASYASASDDFVGYAVEVVRCGQGPSGEKGSPLIRRITEYDHANKTLKIQALPWSTVDKDQFNLLLPHNGWWSVSTAGSQTLVVDSFRDEADDFWVGAAEKGGPYAIRPAGDAITSTLNVLVSDFSTATGRLTVASMAASTALGDFIEVWEWPEIASGAPIAFNQPRVDRPAVTGSRGVPRGVAGLREGSGQVELRFKGPGSSRVGSAAEIDTPLGAITTAAAGTDYTVSTGSTVSSVTVTSGTPAADSMYCTEAGDVLVATTSADPIVPSPSLRIAPAANTTLYGMRTYKPCDTINYALAVKQWHGKGVEQMLVGCVPTITFEFARGDFLKVMVNLQAADGFSVDKDSANAAISRTINPKLPTITSRVLGDVRVNIDGAEIEAKGGSIDLGIQIQPHINLAAPNQTDGFVIAGPDQPTGTIDVYLDSDSKEQIQDFLSGKPVRFLVQAGKAPGEPGVFGFWAYEIEYTGGEIQDDAGQKAVSLPWRVTEDTTTSLSRWMVGVV